MFSTTILIAMFWIFAIAAFFLGLFPLAGCRWAKIAGVTCRRALFAALLVNAAYGVILTLFSWYVPTDAVLILALGVAELGATVLATGLILSMIFKAPLSRCLLAWLPTWIPQLGLLALLLLVCARLSWKRLSPAATRWLPPCWDHTGKASVPSAAGRRTVPRKDPSGSPPAVHTG